MATFNDLPIELVEHIWSFFKHDLSGKRHLCAALVPTVRRNLYSTTRPVTKERLHQLAALVLRPDPFLRRPNGVKSVGDCVRDLILPSVDFLGGCDWAETRKAITAVKRVLRFCGEVECVTCRNLGPMRVLLSAHPAPFLELPKLKELICWDAEAERGTPLSQGQFVHLRRFPALRNLVIELEWEEGAAFGTSRTPRPSTSGLSPVNLSLYAGESLATPGAALFIADLAQLTRLEIHLRCGVDLGQFLQACPVTLTVLMIHYCEELLDDEGREPVNVEADLARFVHLTDLTLGAHMYSPTCELFPILSSHLPRLRTLALEPGTHLVAAKLLPYVHARGGPARQLDKLTLDSIEFDTDPLPSEYPRRPDVENGSFNFRNEWHLPKWTASFGVADARALISAAARVGVELAGETVRAAEYDEVRAREEAYLQTRRDEILYSLRSLFGEGEA